MDDRGDPTLIDLAREPAFPLGRLEVRPATLEVIGVDRREQLEPRIMQVLVALARKPGEVVSRDELTAVCWGGRIVGEDAINRCISRLRKLGEDLGGFEIETVPRVGFRLTETDRKRSPRRLWPWAAMAAVLVVVLLGGWWLWQDQAARAAASDPRIAVLPFTVLDGDPASRTFAAKLTDELIGFLSENGIAPVSAGTHPGQRAAVDLELGGTVSQDADGWRVRAHLNDSRADVAVWSGEFTAPTADDAALRDRTAANLTEIVYGALAPLHQKGLRLDPTTLALFIRANNAGSTTTAMNSADPLVAYEQIVARAPNFALGRAGLSRTLAYKSSGAPPGEREALRRRARSEAERAMRYGLYERGDASDTLYTLARAEQRGELVVAEDALLRVITAGSKFPYVHMRECRFLLELGRAADALGYCQQALALRRLAPPIAWPHAVALDAAGSQRDARDAIRQALRYHPDHFQVRRVNFEFAAFSGSPDEALAILHDPKVAPLLARASQTTALELFLKARRSGASADIDAAIDGLRAEATDRYSRRNLILAAALLGRPDDAFAALADPRLEVAGDPGILLDPAAASLRRDPRFWAAAARAGYVRYWQTRNAWPDFCTQPAPPVDCKAAAARAVGA